MFVRRLSIAAGSAAAMVALSAGSAFAHHCYFVNGNPNAEANRANTPAFRTFHDLAFEMTGLCDDGIEHVAGEIGIEPTTVIHWKATMASGSGGNKAIAFLDMNGINAAMPLAIQICSQQQPE